jgi:hypothetical protein
MGRRIARWLGALVLTGAATAAAAQDGAAYVEQWGPPEGTAYPMLEAPDHTGAPRTFGDLVGERGLLLQFSRSVDW